MHHRKTKTETGQNRVYYTTQQWLCSKAEKHVREVVKERLAPPRMRHVSFQEHVDWLNLRIQGWKNYYATPYSSKWMTKLDWYIRQRLTKWYAKKRQRSNWRGSGYEVKFLSQMYGLKTLL